MAARNLTMTIQDLRRHVTGLVGKIPAEQPNGGAK